MARGTHRVSDGAPVAIDRARSAWADAARPVLQSVARRYHATITYSELADAVQRQTGISTGQLMYYWIGPVLHLVADGCRQRSEPLLTSLCVRADGTVGDGYAEEVGKAYGGAPPADPERHAAEERLACYRHFGAVLPADGGRPALTPQVKARRDRAAARRPEPKDLGSCPNCFMKLPLSGICGNCA